MISSGFLFVFAITYNATKNNILYISQTGLSGYVPFGGTPEQKVSIILMDISGVAGQGFDAHVYAC